MRTELVAMLWPFAGAAQLVAAIDHTKSAVHGKLSWNAKFQAAASCLFPDCLGLVGLDMYAANSWSCYRLGEPCSI